MKDKTARVIDIDNFRAIDATLTTSGQPTEDQLRAVADEGYEVVINLALHNHPRYSLPDEAGLVESLGMTYIHIPVQFEAPGEAEPTSTRSSRPRGKTSRTTHFPANPPPSAAISAKPSRPWTICI